jgi:uncharacterized protein YqfA (UPF0365 family)
MPVVEQPADKERQHVLYDSGSGNRCAIDLAGRDILDAVHTSVNPKVIDCPAPSSGRSTIDAVAKDGIQLKARARVTVRPTSSGSSAVRRKRPSSPASARASSRRSARPTTHKAVLENPDNISKVVLAQGARRGTAFEILSIDIADVDVGENIGAKLQADQAEADKRRFQAEAEKRRAMAVAQEQEYQAEVQKNRALVVLAEAEVPKAMAEAFRSGKQSGIMDYASVTHDALFRPVSDFPDVAAGRCAGG